MSYGISLVEPDTKKTIRFAEDHQVKSVPHAFAGTHEAALRVTSNYGALLRMVLGQEHGIRVLYGKTGEETIQLLEKAINELGDEMSEDYWTATPGNVKVALMGLLTFAKKRPDGIWQGD